MPVYRSRVHRYPGVFLFLRPAQSPGPGTGQNRRRGTCMRVLYQEPMRAEGPKERPTAVLCIQLSARYVQIRQTAKFEILRPSGYYITTF